ncbi:hypothetical protein [Streptomyces sp. BE133]|uniref:hypothetical protein n=1 Tax=Streptomyces sp. BE133 TaxID=3002523 RepID=UPI002E7A2E90|nr:hypothetical protein [Streptomyces sp. BE133]MEE1805386.1 hypothetical protein [Streptomyces sp. BE133]
MGFGEVVQTDGIKTLLGDPFGAVKDRGDCCLPDESGQAPDSFCGPLVEIGRVAGECPGPVRVEVECCFYPRDQLAEGLACAEACREGPAFHQARACSELRPADPGEQGGVGDVDARVHERRTDAFGEWFLDYLKGRDVTLCSRNFAPDGPFYEFLP